MAPPPSSPTTGSPPTMSPVSPAPSPVPPPVPVETHPNRGAFKPPQRALTDPSRLAPEDAYKSFSPPRLRPLSEIHGVNGSAAASAAAAALRPAVASLRAPPAIPPVAARLEQERRRNASRKRRKPHVWKKLLWIKQEGFPDNYTDTETFLDHLQRNPRLRPYDFWPLVADSTVIVQHVCSVAVFVCAYAGIYQGRLSPVTVVTFGTIATVFGWIMWDYWMGQEEADELDALQRMKRLAAEMDDGSSTSSGGSALPITPNGHVNGRPVGRGLGLTLSTTNLAAKNKEQHYVGKHIPSLSKSSMASISPIDSLTEPQVSPFPDLTLPSSHLRVPQSPISLPPISPTTLPQSISPRNQARLKTFKSAFLIYFALLGLSPILKSLTKSTSSDSIWALATWLLIINIFFFDYGSVYIPSRRPLPTQPLVPSISTTPLASDQPIHTSINSPPFPSSLSTNAALMASTVLASRLSTSTAVFSLTLFSIQIYGLFPVFRRHLRYKSPLYHHILTVLLVTISTSSLGLILSQSYTHTYGDCGYCLSWIWHVILRGTIGLVVGGACTMFVMGGCSWWLISLQRYKNVVIGPWDPAKPVLAGGMGRGRTGTD